MSEIQFGQIVLLNGTPRAGKSSIAKAIQEMSGTLWVNLGVDRIIPMVPAQYQPGIGLRPGGERPDLEKHVRSMYLALYDSIAAHSRRGLNVVADVGHHDVYASGMRLLPECAAVLCGLPSLFVAVRCPLDEILRRRKNTWGSGALPDGSTPPPVLLWQQSVHSHGIYDLEVDTSLSSVEECARAILSSPLLHAQSAALRRHAKSNID